MSWMSCSPPTYNGRAIALPPRPPWHVVSSRELAGVLGVTLQTLANWRVRGIGPPPEPSSQFKGHREHYRIDRVLAWLSERNGEPRQPWTFNAAFIAQHLGATTLSAEETAAAIATLEHAGVWPHRWRRRLAA